MPPGATPLSLSLSPSRRTALDLAHEHGATEAAAQLLHHGGHGRAHRGEPPPTAPPRPRSVVFRRKRGKRGFFNFSFCPQRTDLVALRTLSCR